MKEKVPDAVRAMQTVCRYVKGDDIEAKDLWNALDLVNEFAKEVLDKVMDDDRLDKVDANENRNES